MNNRQVVEQFVEAMRSQDLDTHAKLVHPDIVVRYPQSGETISGRDNYQAMLASFPGGLGQTSEFDTHGPRESVQVVSPFPFGMPSITISGSGDTFIMEGLADYQNEGVFYIAAIVQILSGLVARATFYFAAPFEAPQWRAAFVDS